MSHQPLFAYEPGGQVIVCSEGPEIIVHDGDDESPLWLHRFDSPVVGVSATTTEVLALDEAGTLAAFQPRQGELLSEVALGARCHGLAVSAQGAIAALAADRVLLRSRTLRTELAVEGPTCAAFAADEATIAVGTTGGKIHLHRLTDGAHLTTFAAGAPVADVTPGPAGCWLVAVEDRVLRLAPDGSSGARLTGLGGHRIRTLACEAAGRLIALGIDEAMVVVLAYPSLDTVASIQYLDKQVTSLACGPYPWLGVGLSGGDGNKINLCTEAVHRTDTHPWRTHHSWMLSSAIDRKALPSAAPAARPAADGGSAGPAATRSGAARGKPFLIGLCIAMGLVAMLLVGLLR